MKNLVKVLFAAFVLVAVSSGAFAQTDASVTANVVTTLTVTKNADIKFGQISTGTAPVLSADSDTKTAVGSNASLGKFTVTGTARATVKVSYAAVTLLNGVNGVDGELTFTPSVYRTELTAATFGDIALPSEQTYTINSSISDAVPGTDHIFIGGILGTIPALSDTFKAGTYTGTFTLIATYN